MVPDTFSTPRMCLALLILGCVLIVAPPALARPSVITTSKVVKKAAQTDKGFIFAVTLTTSAGVTIKVDLKGDVTNKTVNSEATRINNKAAAIRKAIRDAGAAGSGSPLEGHVAAAGAGATATLNALGGGKISSVKLSGNAAKGEKDNWINGNASSYTPEDWVFDYAIFSLLDGFNASGFAPDGSSGFLELEVGGQLVHIDTVLGMQPIDIEDLIMSEFDSLGIPSRFATIQELEEIGGGTDGRVILIGGLDATGFIVDFHEDGFVLDGEGFYFSVPEPATLAQLALGGLMLARRRRHAA